MVTATVNETIVLPGDVHVASDRDDLFDDLGSWVTAVAARSVDERGVFHVALSGGSTPEPFYMRLVIDPRFRGIPWQRTHVWLVDERRVPQDDERSNWRMIRESLVDHVPAKRRHLHPMPVLDDDPATRYEAQLREAFGHEDIPAMDFILLGMGDDTHTASLFPGSDATRVTDRWIAVNDGPKVTPPPRVTMTFPLLNAARHVAVLCCGEGKRDALQRVAAQWRDTGPDPQAMPITGVDPEDGELMWYLDASAAGRD